MRSFLALMVAFLIATPAAAQTSDGRPAETERGTIGLPLPRIGLPHPAMGLPPVTPPSREAQPAPRPRGRGERHHVIHVVPIWVPFAANKVGDARTPASAKELAESPAPARLRLSVEPQVDQHVYVDGYYVGSREDVAGGFELEPGVHTLEIRADGYEALQIPMRLESGRSVAYRGRLTPAAVIAATPESAGPAHATTYYLIPGCYMGDVPPGRAALPPACDPGKAITVTR